jgi:hypothetical protein
MPGPVACRAPVAAILLIVMIWLLAAVVLSTGLVAVLAAVGWLAVRRYSGSHLVAHFAIAGRGLYFSRTPDGSWWRLRLRPRGRVCEDRGGWGEPPPDSGVREPLRPLGPGPRTGAVELDPPPS